MQLACLYTFLFLIEMGLFLLSMHICWNANARIRDDKSSLPTTIQNTNSEERSYRKDSQKHFCNTTLYPAVV